MPISSETIQEANQKMLGKTNRAILFAKVNLDEFIDPEVPEEDREYTPTLEAMLARINDTPDEQFLDEVREKLTVTSFKEFLDKFQPGFYYRVRPTAAPEPPPAEETYDAGGDEGEAGEEGGGGSGVGNGAVEDDAPPPPPQLEFSLEGGPGWKKVRITSEHPYLRCLSDLIKKRVRQDIATFRVDVDASLFAFKPKNQRALMRKIAEDVQVKNDRLMLEAKRNPGSPDTKRALEAYTGAADEFQGALEDHIRVLPTVVYGLEQTARELKRLAPGGGPVDTNVYQIEFGTKKALIATPQKLPQLGGAPLALDTAVVEQRELGAGADQAALGAGADSTALAKQEGGAGGGTALAVRTVEQALDVIRKESVKYSQTEIALVPQEKRFPIALGKFMDKMINRSLIAPLMGNLVATVLQNPKELAVLSPDIKDVEHFHDVFLGVYSNAVEDFLKTATPLFETIMGVYLLFNEFPPDVRLPEGKKPALIVANSDLPDLMLTRPQELERFFSMSNAQATNQFRDAISFAIVPNVAEFRKKRPAKKKSQQSIMLDDPLLASIMEAQSGAGEDSGGYGRTTFVDEISAMMEWGSKYFFQIIFSPEERIRAGRAQADFFGNLADAYAVEFIVDSEHADSLIMCVPDFVVMPPDGKLVTGKTANGEIEVGVDVPELTARSCYVCAGRLMANDVPDYARRKLQKAKKDPSTLHPGLPGIGVDLSKHPYMGETDLPTDHFLNDGVLGNLLSPNMPFAVFTHVSGRSPFLSVPRTMRRLSLADGSQAYRHLHLFRQQGYLNRLLRAAHELGLGGAFPSDNATAEEQIAQHIQWILKWSKWYDPEKFVNSFPSHLLEGNEFTVRREDGNRFKIQFNFEQGVIAEFDVLF